MLCDRICGISVSQYQLNRFGAAETVLEARSRPNYFAIVSSRPPPPAHARHFAISLIYRIHTYSLSITAILELSYRSFRIVSTKRRHLDNHLVADRFRITKDPLKTPSAHDAARMRATWMTSRTRRCPLLDQTPARCRRPDLVDYSKTLSVAHRSLRPLIIYHRLGTPFNASCHRFILANLLLMTFACNGRTDGRRTRCYHAKTATTHLSTFYILLVEPRILRVMRRSLAFLIMAAVDPTYPLLPIACFLSSAMLLLVLLTSFIRQSWNLGVAFLCFWLFWENLTLGINHIIWSDNADIKLYVYCDIVSHLALITYVVKPMATLIISRRLYLITRLQSVERPNKAAKRKELAIEWSLGLVIPLVVAGPLYYIIQQLRFEVNEGFGCDNSPDGSILEILLLDSWSIIPPLVSIAIYYPHVARLFYRQRRDINHFLRTNDSVSRTNYFRILALASIDILLTLPIGITNIVLDVKTALSYYGSIPFYFGWTYEHTDWEPESFSYADIVVQGTSSVAQFYFNQWTSPILAFAIFALFGVTSEARASYWRIICTIGGWIGWKPTPCTRRARSPLGDIAFGERPAQNSMSLGLDSNPSFINRGGQAQERASGEVESGADKEIEEVRRITDGTVDAEHQSGYQAPHCAKAVDASSAV
ncbi:unnamed protein product [Peniophora sp. CBMAI 1063]|nr:unnamed protein product [Peniophora sp. CBMAI 1063]